MRNFPALLTLTFLLGSCNQNPSDKEPSEFSMTAFIHLMEEVAAGWNANDARRAADCFTEDAVYVEPPDKQIYRGREALFAFFGGPGGRDQPMSMVWHHLTFNPDTSIGMGEFSFAIADNPPSHGVIVVRIRDGKIANWREYYYESNLSWEDFIATNPF